MKAWAIHLQYLLFSACTVRAVCCHSD
jgi:hypothetical protein